MDLTGLVTDRDLDGLRQAIALGADIEGAHVTPAGAAICWAAEWGRDDVVELLIEAGAGRVPEALLAAVRHGHRDTARLLLASGWDPGQPAGRTPLHVAAYNCDVELVGVLLAAGADPAARTSGLSPWGRDWEAMTPLEVALRRGREREEFADRSVAVAGLLTENGTAASE